MGPRRARFARAIAAGDVERHMSIMAESRSSAGDVERHMSIMAESRSSLVAQPVSLPTSLPSVSEAFDKLLHVAKL